MKLTIFYTFLLLKVVSARYAFMPRFFAQDSAIIVDTDKTQISTNQLQRSRQVPYYPVYQIVPRLPPVNNGILTNKEFPKSIETIKPQTTEPIATQSIILTKDEFTKDLLDIALNKLGINNLDEVPSISELGELLGTESAQETIKYIREITATKEGIALVKAYIESSDYTDSTGLATIPSTTDYSTSTSNEYAYKLDSATPSLFQRLSAYFSAFDFFLTKKGRDFEENLQQPDRSTTQKSVKKPLLVRHSLPHHYPIPIRPVVIYKPRNAVPAHHNAFRPVDHLNTPKFLKQPIKTVLSPVLKFSNAKSLLEQKQKRLTLLNENVSKFPKDLSDLVDAQYAAAIEKAIESDEDLRKRINSTDTRL